MNQHSTSNRRHKVVPLRPHRGQGNRLIQDVRRGREAGSKWMNCLIYGGCLLALIGSVGTYTNSRKHHQDQIQALAEAKETYQATIEENRVIQGEYQQTLSPDYLEQVARRDYYYSKPGEIILNLDDSDK